MHHADTWLAGAAVATVLLAAAGGWIAPTLLGKPTGSLAPAPTALATGLLQIEVSPSARVEVDGIDVGTAPPLNQLALPEGRHTVTLHHGDAPPHSVSVEIAARQPAVVTHRFDRLISRAPGEPGAPA